MISKKNSEPLNQQLSSKLKKFLNQSNVLSYVPLQFGGENMLFRADKIPNFLLAINSACSKFSFTSIHKMKNPAI